VSARPVKIWSMYFSEGYDMLSFVMEARGRRTVVRRNAIGWDSNVPRTVDLGPGRSFVVPVDLSDGSWSASFSGIRIGKFSDSIESGVIQAVLEIRASSAQAEHGVLAGTFRSRNVAWSRLKAK
jgi:hypothetical protein